MKQLAATKRFAEILRNRSAVIPVIGNIILALLVSMVLIAVSGADPFLAISSLFRGAFGSWNKVLETLIKSTPLIGVGLAIAIGFTGGVFNIGVEGQFLAGAFVCGLLGIFFPGLPGYIYIPLLLLAGLTAGALYALLPAIAKISRGVHEIITTIMLNYIGLYVIHYLVYTFFKTPGDIAAMDYLPASAKIPRIFPGGTSRLSWSFIIILLFALLLYYMLRKSTLGFEIRATGMNRHASLYSGIRIKRTMLTTFLLSGALAGLAGGMEVIGLHGRYYDGFAEGYGFAGIPIALLARKNPIGVIFAGIFIGALNSGALEMQITAGVPKQLVEVIQGLIILFVAGEKAFKVLREHLGQRRRQASAFRLQKAEE